MKLRTAFQSTPPVKAATLDKNVKGFVSGISIHAAREGGDILHGLFANIPLDISIHAAREGGDILSYGKRNLWRYFNPRRP